jgi:hypothetical protein
MAVVALELLLPLLHCQIGDFMKVAVLFALISTCSICLAADVVPKSFGVQYLAKSITDSPMISFTFTINAKDFPSMGFSTISASIVGVNDQVIAPAQLMYSKSPSTTIVGSEALILAYNGAQAADVIKALRNSKINFSADDGSGFTVDLSALCVSDPESFVNLLGKSGCP